MRWTGSCARPGLLAALGEAARRLRVRLGETRDSLRTHTTPVVEATTSSLDALKAYSMGLRARRQDGDEASLPLFRKAVELDGSFALAHARLATVLGNRGLIEDSAAHAIRAYDLRGKVNEYERLYIEATYHSQVTGDDQQRINTLKVLAQTYPHDFAAQNNLATAYMAVGDWDAALMHARRSMELAPTNGRPAVTWRRSTSVAASSTRRSASSRSTSRSFPTRRRSCAAAWIWRKRGTILRRWLAWSRRRRSGSSGSLDLPVD
jgi:tetratricopeptide (TPR) repeat protein